MLNILVKRFFIALMLFAVLLIPQSAFAMDNADYVNSPEFWYSNKVTNEIDLSTVSNNQNLGGQFKYYVNPNSYEIYIYTNITEKSITNSNTGFFFAISNKYKNNQKIDITYSSNNDYSDYEVLTNFKGYNGFAKNTIGFKLTNRLDIACKTTITAGIIIGEHSYAVMDFSLGSEKTAKSGSNTSKNSSSSNNSSKSKSAKEKATKFSAAYSGAKTNQSSSKSKSDSTSKYSYSQNGTANNAVSNNSVISKGDVNTNVDGSPVTAEIGRESKKLSSMSKIGIIVGAAIIVIGIFLFVIKNKKVRDIICRSVKDTNENT